MQFIYSPDSATGRAQLHEFLQQSLAENDVLWLLSGGSNITTSCDVMNGLDPELTERLTVALIDERYGAVGHADSNFQQLVQGGFTAKAAQFIPVLQAGLNLQQTADQYNATLQRAFASHHIVVGQLGIGPDGHLAGILPHSPAVDAPDRLLVTAYVSQPYERVTITFAGLRQLTTSFVFAFGNDKHQPLADLQIDKPLADQPAQILKTMPDVYLYNDYQA